MLLLNRYISKNVISATLLALLILLGVQTFIDFLGELRDIGTKNYDLIHAILFVPTLLPSDVYQFFPMAAVVGTLMGLGKLASRSELIAMRAAGISVAQVTWVIFKTSILMLIVVTALGEWIAPHAEHYGETRKAIAMNGGQAIGCILMIVLSALVRYCRKRICKISLAIN